MSAVTRFKQSVSHGKERKAHQPSPAPAWITLPSVLTCTDYVCLVTPFCHWCMTIPEAMAHFLLQSPRFHSRPAHPPGNLRRPPHLATCCPSLYLCLLEEDRPATTPVIPTQD
ncbi:hypothetical protein E2C01_048678 [Portunus trituberculatus]|uniref:Uncharacterized protein n=1 Tax=Portunus trituberculatus TaxID=210409 RepID=A0A5B7GBS1_PORTR|nr:hypothetical protein [Portunus trituberculatus]